MKFTGGVAWITGGARIGAVVAEELARRGMNIALTHRSSRAASEATAEKLRALNVDVLLKQADVTRERDVQAVVAAIEKKWGRLDVLVNMASVYEKRDFEKTAETDWRRDIDANATSVYLTARHSAALLKKSSGRVINIADWVAASGRPRYKKFVGYYAAKSAVLGLTQSLALELAPRVLVNAIAPGPILPPAGISNEEVRDVSNVTPLRKWGGALEIAKTVLFLCDTGFVTGECIRVDGGRHLY
jgi:NAD(P)-dependent dehydrogenase (short-subunit alcohol dehydrogenase family)